MAAVYIFLWNVHITKWSNEGFFMNNHIEKLQSIQLKIHCKHYGERKRKQTKISLYYWNENCDERTSNSIKLT